MTDPEAAGRIVTAVTETGPTILGGEGSLVPEVVEGDGAPGVGYFIYDPLGTMSESSE